MPVFFGDLMGGLFQGFGGVYQAANLVHSWNTAQTYPGDQGTGGGYPTGPSPPAPLVPGAAGATGAPAAQPAAAQPQPGGFTAEPAGTPSVGGGGYYPGSQQPAQPRPQTPSEASTRPGIGDPAAFVGAAAAAAARSLGAAGPIANPQATGTAPPSPQTSEAPQQPQQPPQPAPPIQQPGPATLTPPQALTPPRPQQPGPATLTPPQPMTAPVTPVARMPLPAPPGQPQPQPQPPVPTAGVPGMAGTPAGPAAGPSPGLGQRILSTLGQSLLPAAAGAELPGGVTTGVSAPLPHSPASAPLPQERAPPGSTQQGTREPAPTPAPGAPAPAGAPPARTGATQVAVPEAGPAGRPQVASEEGPKYPHATSDALRMIRSDPQRLDMLNRAVQQEGAGMVSPQLAAWAVSGTSVLSQDVFNQMSQMGVQHGLPPLDPNNPQDQMNASVRYLHTLALQFGSNTPATLYAYMRGPGAPERIARIGLQAEANINPQAVAELGMAFGYKPVTNGDLKPNPAFIRGR